ncbi:MAG: CotH kinase family protein [Deltaproteobacteria bacterium]|nr:CotH kinase family protein [Deltaproteobacteria bacterium]
MRPFPVFLALGLFVIGCGGASQPAKTLVINEVVTSTVGDEDDWFELLVVGTEPVQLSGYAIVDDNPNHSPATLPDITLLPGEFGVIRAVSAEGGGGVDTVPFKLGSDDSLTLTRGGLVVDSVDWPDGAAPQGTSHGRLPDGTGTFQMLKPTPGDANQSLDAAICTDPFPDDRVIDVDLELSEEAWSAIRANPMAEEFHRGTFVFDGIRVEDVGIRTKGNSSLSFVTGMGSDRFPFKVDFNRYVVDRKFCGLGKVVLNNGFKDPTLIREHIAYRLAREFGLKASRTQFVDLTMAGQHMGLYTMVEPVDDDFFLEANFANDNGDLYKPELPHGTLRYEGDSFDDYPSVQVENNEETTDHGALLALIDTINHGPSDALSTVLDVDAMLRYAAFDTLLVNLDSYTGNGHNYYLYEQDGVFTPIPWDLNEAFGNFSCGCDRQEIIDFRVDEPTCGPTAGRPLVDALLAVPEFRKQYREHLSGLLEGYFNEDVMGAWIRQAADRIRPYVENDPTKLYSTADFEKGLVEDVNAADMPMGSVVIGLQAFIEERSASMVAQLAGELASGNGGQGNCQGGTGPGPNPGLCPDGVCDAAEQADPKLCPEDCQR